MNTDVITKIQRSLSAIPSINNAWLFGSYAKGTENESSDIDLIVILDIPGFAGSYREYLERKQSVSKKLRNLRMQYGLDLLVYTRDEWELLLAEKNTLAHNVSKTGLLLQ